MVNTFIKIVAKNIDGCGEDVEALILVRTEDIVTEEQKKRLENAADFLRSQNAGWNVLDIINGSIVLAFGLVEWEVVSPDMEVCF